MAIKKKLSVKDSEKFKISKVYENKVYVINIVTAPEIEILIIINENRYKDYLCSVTIYNILLEVA